MFCTFNLSSDILATFPNIGQFFKIIFGHPEHDPTLELTIFVTDVFLDDVAGLSLFLLLLLFLFFLQDLNQMLQNFLTAMNGTAHLYVILK
jgi:hypothetical protein